MKKILIAICIILIIVILGIVIYINIQEQSNPSSTGEENRVVNNNVTNNEQNQSDINTTSATMEYTNAVPSNYFNKKWSYTNFTCVKFGTRTMTQALKCSKFKSIS